MFCLAPELATAPVTIRTEFEPYSLRDEFLAKVVQVPSQAQLFGVPLVATSKLGLLSRLGVVLVSTFRSGVAAAFCTWKAVAESVLASRSWLDMVLLCAVSTTKS